MNEILVAWVYLTISPLLVAGFCVSQVQAFGNAAFQWTD